MPVGNGIFRKMLRYHSIRQTKKNYDKLKLQSVLSGQKSLREIKSLIGQICSVAKLVQLGVILAASLPT